MRIPGLSRKQEPAPAITPLRIRKLADKTDGERVKLLRFHPSNLLTDDDGRVYVNPEHGERILFNPATPEVEHEPWPFAGLEFPDGPPVRTRIPTNVVERGMVEGWIVTQGGQLVHRPGGPPEEPWRVIHTFWHLDAITFRTRKGDVKYAVIENPDKWPESKTGELGFGGEVRWYYEIELWS